MNSLEEIVSRIKQIENEARPILIAVDGVGGSGKTSLAKAITHNFSHAIIVEMDDFYLPKLGKPDINRLYTQVIKPLRNNQTATYPIYDWKSDSYSEAKSILPSGIVIIEGVYSLDQELADNYDVKIWVECPPEIGMERGVARDGEEVREKWMNIWMPMEKEYVKEQNPKIRADYIVSGDNAA